MEAAKSVTENAEITRWDEQDRALAGIPQKLVAREWIGVAFTGVSERYVENPSLVTIVDIPPNHFNHSKLWSRAVFLLRSHQILFDESGMPYVGGDPECVRVPDNRNPERSYRSRLSFDLRLLPYDPKYKLRIESVVGAFKAPFAGTARIEEDGEHIVVTISGVQVSRLQSKYRGAMALAIRADGHEVAEGEVLYRLTRKTSGEYYDPHMVCSYECLDLGIPQHIALLAVANTVNDRMLRYAKAYNASWEKFVTKTPFEDLLPAQPLPICDPSEWAPRLMAILPEVKLDECVNRGGWSSEFIETFLASNPCEIKAARSGWVSDFAAAGTIPEERKILKIVGDDEYLQDLPLCATLVVGDGDELVADQTVVARVEPVEAPTIEKLVARFGEGCVRSWQRAFFRSQIVHHGQDGWDNEHCLIPSSFLGPHAARDACGVRFDMKPCWDFYDPALGCIIPPPIKQAVWSDFLVRIGPIVCDLTPCDRRFSRRPIPSDVVLKKHQRSAAQHA